MKKIKKRKLRLEIIEKGISDRKKKKKKKSIN